MSTLNPQSARDLDDFVLSDLVSSLHVINGPGGECLCGVYGDESLTCSDILGRMSEDIRRAIIMANCGGKRIQNKGQ